MNLSVDPFSPPHRIKEVITLLVTEAINKPGAPGAGKSLKAPGPAGAESSGVLTAICPLLGSAGISVLVPMKGPLLCGPFWVPDLISPIQLFNHVIKVAVVAMETVWVAVGEGLWALRVCLTPLPVLRNGNWGPVA